MASPLPKTHAAASSSSRSGRAKRLDIQGLRAVAVLMVVAFHSGLPVPGGFIGVDVFFVISGFVISGMLQREWATTGRIRFGTFYLRRFKRLTPALALMITVTMIVSVFTLSPMGPLQTGAKTTVGAMLLAANFVISRVTSDYFAASAETNALLHTWSLSVEEQFYLVFPALIAFGWHLSGKSRRLRASPVVIVSAVAIGSFALTLLGASGFAVQGSWIVLGFYSPFTRAWEFAVGALLALAIGRVQLRSHSSSLTAAGLGVALLTVSLWLITKSTPFPSLWTVLPVVGTLLLLLAGTHETNAVTRLLGTIPMVKVGDWSYSIYLWHWPMIVFAAMLWPGNTAASLLAAIASFAPALSSYRWIEQPIRSLQTASRARLAGIVVATVAPPLLAASAVFFAAQHGLWIQAVQEFQAAVMPLHRASFTGCVDGPTLDVGSPGSCTWNSSAGGASIYLVGDSIAEQFGEAVMDTGKALDRPVVASIRSACAFVDPAVQAGSASLALPARCVEYVNGTIDYLTHAASGLVIITMSDKYWFGTSDTESAIESVTRELGSAVTKLQGAGQQVLLVQSTPKWHGSYPWNASVCSTIDVVRNECRQRMPRAWAEQQQRVLREAMSQVASDTGASLADPWTVLCSDAECSTMDGDRPRYRDETHITVGQSESMAPWVAEAIDGANDS